ncbi:MAG: Gfo/Idh/MocA family oxidoreductase, partial [Limisphaerales bacterium]
MHSQAISRRSFARKTLFAAGALAAAPAFLRGQNLNSKLNIAVIACGGRGAANMQSVSSENIVALCDVNMNNLSAAAAKHPKAKTFRDFRKLFEHAKDFDAVTVSTCEHTHAFATMLALKHDKHVY